jgi:hypothetical protein
MNNPNRASKAEARCRYLRSKEMYYQGTKPEEDQFSSGLYWCMQTHETFGPDSQPVGKHECRAGRTCFGA